MMILSVDLGKFKSVFCAYQRAGKEKGKEKGSGLIMAMYRFPK